MRSTDTNINTNKTPEAVMTSGVFAFVYVRKKAYCKGYINLL